MAVQNDDLVLIQRGQLPFRDTTANLATFINGEITSGGSGADVPTASATTQGVIRVGTNLTIEASTGILSAVIPSGLLFKGTWNQTDTSPASGSLTAGNFYIWNGANGATLNNSTWGSLDGTTVNTSDRLMWTAGDDWVNIGDMGAGSGVQTVTGTAPISVDSSDAENPDVSITAATTSDAGSMSAADKTKLDGIAAGAQVNVNPTQTYTAGTRTLTLSPGDDTTVLPVATTTAAGLMSAADKTTLDNISSNPSGVASITAGNGINVDADTPAVPVVSVNFGTVAGSAPTTVMPYDLQLLTELP